MKFDLDFFQMPESLYPYIESFYRLEIEANGNKFNHTSVYPLGRSEWIINLGKPVTFKLNNEQHKVSGSVLLGQLTIPVSLESKEKIKLMGIRFHPWIVSHLFRFEQFKLKNKMMDTVYLKDKYFGGESRDLIRENRIKEFVDSIISYSTTLPPMDEKLNLTASISKKIIRKSGVVKLADLQHEFCITERTMERYFRTYVGLSPQEFCNVIRFSKAYEIIQKGNYKSFTDICFELDYTDASHLIKEFRKFTGKTPGASLP